MAPKTATRAIKDALEDLLKRDFERFVDALLDRRAAPRVRRNAVEAATRLELGDLLVQTFTKAGAPGVVEELLRGIDCHEAADTLAAETSGASSKPASSDTPRPSAGAPGVTAMAGEKSSGEQFVDEHRGQLIDRVTDVGPVLDGLLDKGVVSQGIYDDIMAKATSVAQMRQLYSGALHAAGRGGKEVFYQLLEKHEPYLMKDLKRNK
ncbi:apoptosis-associated speck-like protein containing a CARD [Pseudoliparis swirei]|uniref:apoptosis-associated speck-like protein containing a CARD n=1 Tax=Pseudoliparis swirei TaxID=2059687 RepID=UPI0024BE8968|nr:apoptosis-associated speck-like protein containing a CARD [Pseudoliparis swirei]